MNIRWYAALRQGRTAIGLEGFAAITFRAASGGTRPPLLHPHPRRRVVASPHQQFRQRGLADPLDCDRGTLISCVHPSGTRAFATSTSATVPPTADPARASMLGERDQRPPRRERAQARGQAGRRRPTRSRGLAQISFAALPNFSSSHIWKEIPDSILVGGGFGGLPPRRRRRVCRWPAGKPQLPGVITF